MAAASFCGVYETKDSAHQKQSAALFEDIERSYAGKSFKNQS
jgi:hypothetical protein